MADATAADAWKKWTPVEVRKQRVTLWRNPDGTFDALPAVASPRVGAVRDDTPYPKGTDPRAATAKALKELEVRHPELVNWAIEIAVQLAAENLTTTSRAVREEMLKRKLIAWDGDAEHWLGAAMNRANRMGALTSTGMKHKYSDAQRGIHERTVTVWALTEGFDAKEFLAKCAAAREKKPGTP